MRDLEPPPLPLAPRMEDGALADFARSLAFDWLLGEHPTMRMARELILRYANDYRPVLVHGEPGTGKDEASKAIHLASLRRERPWVFANLTGLGETAYGEIFGYEKGAFTGAWKRHDGYLRQAHGTTLVLLEVTAIPTSYQAMLLRAIETKRFRPLKADREIYSDFRVIAMTNEPMGRAIAEGRFRLDLYSRLKVLTLWLPPLRERLSDLDLLVPHFLRKATPGAAPKRLTRDAMAILCRYSWPGNVRELKHLLEESVVQTPGPVVGGETIARLLKQGAFSHALPDPGKAPIDLRDPEVLKRALETVGGNKRELARRARVSPTTLYKHLEIETQDPGE